MASVEVTPCDCAIERYEDVKEASIANSNANNLPKSSLNSAEDELDNSSDLSVKAKHQSGKHPILNFSDCLKL